MKINIAIIALILVIPFQTDAQRVLEGLKVPLRLYTKNIPFELQSGCLTWLYEGSRSRFKGIPDYFNNSNCIIKTVNLGDAFSANDSIYLIIGDKNDIESVCIIDSNNDHDFSNDYQYHYNKDSLSDASVFPSQAIQLKYSYGGEKISNTIYLRPDFYASIRYSNPIAQKYFVVLRLAECRIGRFTFNNVAYEVAAAMHTPRPLYDSSTVFSIIKYGGNFPPGTNNLNFYNLNQDIFVDDQIFKIINIAPFGDSLFVKHVGKRAAKETGYKEGFYAPVIAGSAMDGKFFDLNSYKGNYVLVDFWGTWCRPCIKMIPELRAYHEKYKNLTMVSIAYEEADAGKLAKAIKRYRMNWINIYKNRNLKSDRNLIKSFKVDSFPTTFLINPDGKIIFRGGSNELGDLKKLLYKVHKE